MSTIMGYSRMTWGVTFVGLVAITALVVAVVAYIKQSHFKKNNQKNSQKTMIPFSAGIMSETGGATVTIGNAENASVIGFGDFSASTISPIADQIRAYSFVVPYTGVLRNLNINVEAGVSAGADPQVFSATIYRAAFAGTCGATNCGVDLEATTLTADATLTATVGVFCVSDRCHSVRVSKGDRIALVVSSGTTTADFALVFNISGGIEIDAGC